MTTASPSPGGSDPLVEALRRRPPRVAIVLGSGLGTAAERITTDHAFDFDLIPSLKAAAVNGHDGRIRLGRWAGRDVLVFCGRLHLYEGHSLDETLAPLRLAVEWGIRDLIITNAAGGIRDDLFPGSLMAIQAHFNLTRPRASTATPQSRAYCSKGLVALRQAAVATATAMAEGVYAAVTGPNYETPAEVRALRSFGCDAVGMSTANEVEFAAAHGVRCHGISCITNRAAGLQRDGSPLTHQEVLVTARSQAHRLGELLERFLERLAEVE